MDVHDRVWWLPVGMRGQWAKPKEGASQGWRIQAAADGADEAHVYLYDAIDPYGVTARDFVPQFRAITAPKITLHVNSPGGDVWDALAIFDAIHKHPSDVTVRVEGIAASSASVIALAGSRTLMAKHSQLMIHDPLALTIGNAADHEKTAKLLDQHGDLIASIYAEKADNGSRHDQQTAKWRERMRAETWFSDQQAVDAGLADAVDDAQPAKVTNRQPEQPVQPPPVAPPVDDLAPWEQVTDAFRALSAA